MDKGNSAAEAGMKGGISFIEKTSLGNVTTQQLVVIEGMKPLKAKVKGITSLFGSFFLAQELMDLKNSQKLLKTSKMYLKLNELLTLL